MGLFLGETVEINMTNRNNNLSYVDADSVIIYIEDKNGTKVINGSSMSNLSTGCYRFNFNTSSGSTDGIYTVWIKATTGSVSNIEQKKFELFKSIV